MDVKNSNEIFLECLKKISERGNGENCVVMVSNIPVYDSMGISDAIKEANKIRNSLINMHGDYIVNVFRREISRRDCIMDYILPKKYAEINLGLYKHKKHNRENNKNA